MKIAEKKKSDFLDRKTQAKLQEDPIREHDARQSNEEPLIEQFEKENGKLSAGTRKKLLISSKLPYRDRKKWRRMPASRKTSLLKRAGRGRRLAHGIGRNVAKTASSSLKKASGGQNDHPDEGGSGSVMEVLSKSTALSTAAVQPKVLLPAIRMKEASKAAYPHKTVPRHAKTIAVRSVRLIRRAAGNGSRKTMEADTGRGAEKNEKGNVISSAAAAGAAATAGYGSSLIKAFLTNPLLLMLLIVLLVILLIVMAASAGRAARFGSSAGGGGYVAKAIEMAADDSIGYNMQNRTMSPDVDCSSFIYYALVNSDYPELKDICKYPFVTSTMGGYLEKLGFTKIPYARGTLEAGDIMVDPYLGAGGHTEIYIGDGKTAAAHSNYDRRPGDSSGREVNVKKQGNRVYKWIYRPPALPASGSSAAANLSSEEVEIVIPEPYGNGRFSYTGYGDIGWIYSVTGPSAINKTAPQYDVWKQWMAQPETEKWDDDIAILNGCYMIACTTTFGECGDYVTFYLEDGQKLECVIADIKSSHDITWNKWGHGLSTLEFEVHSVFYPNRGKWLSAKNGVAPGSKNWHPEWMGKRVAKAVNHGGTPGNTGIDFSQMSIDQITSILADGKKLGQLFGGSAIDGEE